jgi:hypothetical protein
MKIIIYHSLPSPHLLIFHTWDQMIVGETHAQYYPSPPLSALENPSVALLISLPPPLSSSQLKA